MSARYAGGPIEQICIAGRGGGVGRALRPVDLARAVGLSTQQIRNYADAGVLPLAPRTPSGHRRFDVRHRRALFAYRALAKGYGPVTAQAIMRAVHAGDVPEALALIDAAHAASHDQRRMLRATGEALEAVARRAPAVPVSSRSGLRIGEVAAHLGIRTSALRVWEAAGLLRPAREPGTGQRRFGPADVRDAQMVHMLRQGHYPLPQIRAVLDEVRRTGSREALSAAIAQRQAALAQTATAMLEGASHLHHYLNDEDPPG